MSVCPNLCRRHPQRFFTILCDAQRSCNAYELLDAELGAPYNCLLGRKPAYQSSYNKKSGQAAASNFFGGREWQTDTITWSRTTHHSTQQLAQNQSHKLAVTHHPGVLFLLPTRHSSIDTVESEKCVKLLTQWQVSLILHTRIPKRLYVVKASRPILQK